MHVYVSGSVCLLWAEFIEGRIIQVEKDEEEKVKRFNQNSKCVQEPKLARFRSSGYRMLFGTRRK